MEGRYDLYLLMPYRTSVFVRGIKHPCRTVGTMLCCVATHKPPLCLWSIVLVVCNTSRYPCIALPCVDLCFSCGVPAKELGFSEDTARLTNGGLLELLDPSKGHLPFIYDNFRQWGTCTEWDPCPECTAAVAFADHEYEHALW